MVNYIRENIGFLSRKEIMQHLKIKHQTLSMLMRKNNIIDDRLYRFCPTCKNKVYHNTIENRINTENLKCNCMNCASLLKTEKYKGVNNPFYGKHHTEEMKQYYKKIHKGKRYSIDTEFKIGHDINNGKSMYYYWNKKYGKDVADEKLEIFKNKISKSMSGVNNPMYGKKSPIGSGNGWSGWYNGWYFRSLIELSYMIYVIERFNIKWESGEEDIYKIPYVYENNIKNYYSDFILDKKYIVECKPKNLWNTKLNKEKFKYAKLFAKNNNMKFKLVDCDKIKMDELITLYNSGKIKLIEKYDKRIKNIINKK